ncbi:hypothetical protein C2857_005462 [Epichloe festucae Fl1]|uniref:FAD dependent oxidoreductase domain-containing protein n=1 Tax=Epichloe festucae (strain Fl1) TaxID=877507 RepID=A0A7S9KKZ9_EPIFF|nr:hypothetical protein C2857_005462 [Epichloe festucae Fl1]
MSSEPSVIIIGAGVIGLSTAVRLQEKFQDDCKSTLQPLILLVAKEWPAAIPGAPLRHSADYASMWAGAHVRPIPATTPQLRQEAKWLKATVAEFDRQVAAEPACGVTRAAGIEYLEAPDEGYLKQDASAFAAETGLSGYERYEPAELPDGVALGFEYDTFCINAPVYCEALLRKFLLMGGKTMKRDLKSEWEAFSITENVKLVINASGTGFGDPKVFPTRGQTVVTDIDVPATVTRQYKDGTWGFLIPRFLHGGTIVGGTKEPGDWRSAPCKSTRTQLLENGLKLQPLAHKKSSPAANRTLEAIRVISDVVGRRPTRQGGMRLEVEKPGGPRHTRGEVLIHAYGAGGRGYEISWGVADEVVEMALLLLADPGQAAAKL